jgi:large subunit ribosomal protein L9
MKVLLLEDVDNLGLAGKIVTVADGYARNYLFPRNLAKPATEGAVREAEQIQRAGERKRAKLKGAAEDLARVIEATSLSFTARAGETGKLYGSITTTDIAEALSEKLGQEIDRRKIVTEPLRQLGAHEVELHLLAGVTAKLPVTVEAEAEEESPVAKA